MPYANPYVNPYKTTHESGSIIFVSDTYYVIFSACIPLKSILDKVSPLESVITPCLLVISNDVPVSSSADVHV